MNGTLILLALLLSTTTTSSAPTASELTASMDKFYAKLNKQTSALTKLKYYIHANFGHGPDQTVHQVAQSELTPNSTANFGRILVVDNKLTTGPNPDSFKVGQYQGMNAYSDFHQASANMNMNIIFTDGEYKGSTISILGRQPVFEDVRVLSVIGGTGAFRFARGTVLATTYSSDSKTNIGVYVYDMFVVTPVVDGSVI